MRSRILQYSKSIVLKFRATKADLKLRIYTALQVLNAQIMALKTSSKQIEYALESDSWPSEYDAEE